MRSKIVIGILIVICFLLQCTVFDAFSIAGITPNLLLVLCISMGLMRGKKSGLFTGFFAGLLIDMFFEPLFGFNALLYMYLGYFSGCFCKVYYDDDIKVPLLMTAGGDLLYGTGIYALQFLLRGRLGFFTYLYRIMIPEMLYTVIAAILFYKIFYTINYRFMNKAMKERDSYWVLK